MNKYKLFDKIQIWPLITKSSGSLENPNTPLDAIFENNQTSAGQNVTPLTALQYSAVWGCVRIISETIASLPVSIYENTGTSQKLAPEHILSPLVTLSPNEIQTRFAFWETLVMHVLLYGNGYAYIKRSKMIPQYLRIIHPDYVTPMLSQDKTKVYYQIDEPENKTTVKSWEIIHIRGLSVDGINGLSPISYHRESIGIGLSEIQFQGSFLGKGANVSGVLENPGSLSEPSYKRIADSWRKTYEGASNTGKTAILEGGTTYKQIGIKPIDAQFLEQRRFTKEDIATIYRVPLHLLQDLSRSTNNNIEHQSIDFVQHTIRPWLKRIEPELNRKLFTEAEIQAGKYYTRFNIDALLRGDVQSRAQLYRALYNTSSIAPNEIRELEGMNPYPGGDEYFIQTNMQPVSMAGKAI